MPRHPMRGTPAVAAAVVAGLLAVGVALWGATHQTSPEEAATGSPSPSGSAPLSTGTPPEPTGSPSGEPVDARSLLDEALVGWRGADTGAFTQVSVIPGIGSLRLEGVYELSSRSSDVTQVFEAEDGDPVEIRFVGARGVTYLNSSGWEPALRTCWMGLDSRVLAESTGVAMVNGADSLPANVVALAHARAARVDPSDPDIVVGTVRLADVASLFGSGLVGALREDVPDAPVDATFRLADGDIVGWRVSGRSMAAALRSGEALAEPNGVLLAAVSSYDVEVEYAGVGATEVDVRLPAAALRMTREQAQSDEGCPAAR